MEKYTLLYDSPLGILRLSSSDNALCSLTFNNSSDLLEVTEGHPLLREAANQLTAYFSGTRKVFDLPLEQEGTLFQQQVWQLLQAIPYGKTISYLALAKAYGDVKAIRAIASANGRNHLPVIIPCHRVIGTDQSLTGYSGGLGRKKWLLEHEARLHAGVQQLF
ncbi:MAG TPA: methylated-DNA--[protein]-cysteine S-methyltransferase [Flavisolibacter sp.]|jgi:methylated-DNA-[protein]-cysteine S-methyltransferase